MLLIHRELFYIVQHEEILNYDVFPLEQVTELWWLVLVLQYNIYMATNLQIIDTKAHSI